MKAILRYLALGALASAVFTTACVRIANYSETEYRYATELKAEALTLMDAATEPYTQHAADVDKLKLDLRKAYEYAAGRPDNEISAKQWDILADSTGNLLGGFLVRWRDRHTLSLVFINDKKKQIGEAFDTISGLESGKVKPGRGN